MQSHRHPDLSLPEPDAKAAQSSERLTRHIAGQISHQGGWIGFDRYMELALYTPGLGYYSGGAHKFGSQGDFVTAPEISPLFGRMLAVQAAQIMSLSAPHIIEAGAGSGRLAVDLLLALEKLGQLPESYRILELSGELRERQHQILQQGVPHLMARIIWLDNLPETFSGLVLGNEILDAMPVQLVRWESDAIDERGVIWQDGRFAWQEKPAGDRLLEAARRLKSTHGLDQGYLSEISLIGMDWIAAWAKIVRCGALLLIDYGFPAHEYYHPQRHTGTLMCHYRHRAHSDPFFLPGLQDITAHVDFTGIAQTGFDAGFDVLGYTTQGNFLFNCGLMEILKQSDASDARIEYLRQSQEAQKLTLPTEMGELFKVIALGKAIDKELTGFEQQDKTNSL